MKNGVFMVPARVCVSASVDGVNYGTDAREIGQGWLTDWDSTTPWAGGCDLDAVGALKLAIRAIDDFDKVTRSTSPSRAAVRAHLERELRRSSGDEAPDIDAPVGRPLAKPGEITIAAAIGSDGWVRLSDANRAANEAAKLAGLGTLDRARILDAITKARHPGEPNGDAISFGGYLDAVSRTAADGVDNDPNVTLTHWALGLAGEAGEVIELVKKQAFTGQPFDQNRMAEELGDVLWYLAALAWSVGIDLDDVAKRNVQKLEKRYPAGFVLGGGNRG